MRIGVGAESQSPRRSGCGWRTIKSGSTSDPSNRITARGWYTMPRPFSATYGSRSLESLASMVSCSSVGGGVTNSSPRTNSYLLPSSGKLWTSSNVHCLVRVAICMRVLSSCAGSAACVEVTLASGVNGTDWVHDGTVDCSDWFDPQPTLGDAAESSSYALPLARDRGRVS